MAIIRNTYQNWEVIEHDTPWDLNTKIYLISRDRIPSLAKIKDGRLELVEIKEGASDEEPTFSMPTDAWLAIKEFILKDKPKVVETLSELKSTKYHLEDMRKLVFKEPTS